MNGCPVLPFETRLRGVAVLVLLLGATAGCHALHPSPNRTWDPEHAVQATAVVDGARVTVDGVRNYRHYAPGEFDVAFDQVELDLDQLQSLDYFLCYPSAQRSAFAHSFLSFGFANGYYLAVSVEARREQGETYGTVKGLLRQYELLYLVADERDIIDLRVNIRGEELYRYRILARPETTRNLLVDLLCRGNALAERPRFYNTLRHNCTTELLEHATEASGRRIASTFQALTPGYSDEVLYQGGFIDTSRPLEEVRADARINDGARQYRGQPDFSRLIRGEVAPDYSNSPR